MWLTIGAGVASFVAGVVATLFWIERQIMNAFWR